MRCAKPIRTGMKKLQHQIITFSIFFICYISLLLSSFSFHLIEVSDFLNFLKENRDENFDRELHIRIIVSCVISLLVCFAASWGALNRELLSERWRWHMLGLFALGATTAVGDPFYSVRSEGNVIGYWTAGVLCFAAAIAIRHLMRASAATFERLLGGIVGAVFLLAACDEVFEFHERGGESIDRFVPKELLLNGQDLIMLGLAVFAALALLAIYVCLRAFPWAHAALRERRYLRSGHFLTIAVLLFLGAMMLDSFDWYADHAVAPFRAAILTWMGVPGIPHWFDATTLELAANDLEEVLEYISAIYLLIGTGVFFSVPALGGEARQADETAGVMAVADGR